MIPGIDTHAGYGVVDWQKVRDAGYRFAYLKCTEGNQGSGKFVDPQFSRGVAECKRLGLAVGAYHFAFPLPDDGKNKLRSPEEQAEIAFRNSQGLGSQVGELAHAVDAEWPDPASWAKWGCTGVQINDWFKRYCEASSALFGRQPIIYTYPSWWRHLSSLADTSWASAYDLWFANYAWTKEGHPPAGWSPPLLGWVNKTWSTWSICQHSADGSPVKVPGVNAAAVDRNVIKDEATFRALLGYRDAPFDFEIVSEGNGAPDKH